MTLLIKITFIFTCISLSIHWNFATAEEDLHRLFQLASEHNPEFNAQRADLRRAELMWKSKFSGYLPTLSLSAAENNAINESQQDSVKLKAELNIFNGLKNKAEIDIEKLNVEASRETLRLTNAEVTKKIKDSYFEYLYAAELNELLKTIVKRRKNQEEMIFLRFKGGREDQGSYLQAKAKYQNAVYEFDKSARSIQANLETLALIVGVGTREIKITNDSLKRFIQHREYIGDLDSSTRETPTYKIKELELQISDKQISAADSQFYPQLNVAGTLGKAGNRIDQINEDVWTTSLTLTLPIFSGGERYFNSKSQRVNKVIKQFNLQGSYNSIKKSLIGYYQAYFDAYEAINIRAEFLSASKMRSEVATSQYRSGLLNYTNWDLVQSELIENEKSTLSSYKTLLNEELILQNALGRGELH